MDYLRLIRDEGERFYSSASAADPTFGVPSRSGFTIADLVWGLGEVHWFWASDIELRAREPAEVEASKPPRPARYEQAVSWGRSQLDRLLDVLSATPDDVPVWTWAVDEADHTVGFIRRHQVQETAIHRWDLQDAATTGDPDPIDAAAASDSIDEFLAVTVPFGVNRSKPLRGTVHLHCTDVDGEWFVEPHGTVERTHSRADVAVRGSASDLLLALYDRVDVETLDVIGDTSLARDLVRRVDTGR
jgi:uncharacterized protein (TIGR03083 family)